MENSLSVNFDSLQSDAGNTTIMMQPITVESTVEPAVQKVAEITLNITLTKKSDPKNGEESGDEPVTYWTNATSTAAAPRGEETPTTLKPTSDNESIPQSASRDKSFTHPQPTELGNFNKANSEELLQFETATTDAEPLKRARPESENLKENLIESVKNDKEASFFFQRNEKTTFDASQVQPRVQHEQAHAEQVPSEQAQLGQVQSMQVIPEDVQANQVHPGQIQSVQIQLGQVQPEQVQPEPQVQPRVQHEQAHAEQVPSEQAQLGQVQSTQVLSEDVQANQVHPGQIQSVQIQLGQVQPEQVQPEPQVQPRVQHEQAHAEQVPSEQAQLGQVQSTQVLSEDVQANQVHPGQIQSVQIGQVQPEQVQPEPVQHDKFQPKQIQSDQVYPGQVQLEQKKPKKIQHEQDQPDKFQSGHVQSEQIKPDKSQPDESVIQEHGDAQSIEPQTDSIIERGSNENDINHLTPLHIVNDLTKNKNNDKAETNERTGSISVSMESPAVIIVNAPTAVTSDPQNNNAAADIKSTINQIIPASQCHQVDSTVNEESKTTQNENIVKSLTSIANEQPQTTNADVFNNFGTYHLEHQPNTTETRKDEQQLSKTENSTSNAPEDVKENTHQKEDIIASLSAIANNEPVPSASFPNNNSTENSQCNKIVNGSITETVHRSKSTEPLDASNLQADTLLIVSSESNEIVTEKDSKHDKLTNAPSNLAVINVTEPNESTQKSDENASLSTVKPDVITSNHILSASSKLSAQPINNDTKMKDIMEADTLIIVSSSDSNIDTNKGDKSASIISKSEDAATTSVENENKVPAINFNVSSEISAVKESGVQHVSNDPATIADKMSTEGKISPIHETEPSTVKTQTTPNLNTTSTVGADSIVVDQIVSPLSGENIFPAAQIPPTGDIGNLESLEKPDGVDDVNVLTENALSDENSADAKQTEILGKHSNELKNEQNLSGQSIFSLENQQEAHDNVIDNKVSLAHHKENEDNKVIDGSKDTEIKIETFKSSVSDDKLLNNKIEIKSLNADAVTNEQDQQNLSAKDNTMAPKLESADREHAKSTSSTEIPAANKEENDISKSNGAPLVPHNGVPTNSVENTNTINTLTNEIPSIVLPHDVADSPNDRPIMYPDSKDWAMSDNTESSRADDEDYDIYDEGDDDGSTVATSGLSDVHGIGHRQALSRGLRLPAAAVADGTVDPTAATLVAAVRAVTRVADERGENDAEPQPTERMVVKEISSFNAAEQKSNLNAEGTANTSERQPPSHNLGSALSEKSTETIPQKSEVLNEFQKSIETIEPSTVKDSTDTSDKIEWIVVPQNDTTTNDQTKTLIKAETAKPQEPSKPAFNNMPFDQRNDFASKELTGIEKFEKLAGGWSGSGINAEDSQAVSFSSSIQNQSEIDNKHQSTETKAHNETESNGKWEIKVTSAADKRGNEPPKTENTSSKEQTTIYSNLSSQNTVPPTTQPSVNNISESKVRFAPDVKDNVKNDDEDYAQAINDYEQSLKKHTRETLELVDKLCDQTQQLLQQKPTENEKAAQNPFDALPKIDSATNEVKWNDRVFGNDATASLSMDIESLRINPGLMVAPVNCLLLPSKRLVIIDNELGILLIDLETRNVLNSSNAPQSTTTKWRYPQCVAFVPEKEHLLVLAECCSTKEDKNAKITPNRISTLAEVLAPKPTDFSLFICRFDAKTLRLIDRVEAPKYIRDKNVTCCQMCFVPPTDSIYLAVNTPYDAFVYELTDECRWIEVYNRRGRNFADLQYFAVVGPVTELLVLETNKQHVVMLSLYGSTVVGQRMVAVTERPAALAVDERAAVFAFDRASACVAQHSSMHFEKLRDIALVDRAQCRLSAQEHLLAVLVCPFKQIKLYKY